MQPTLQTPITEDSLQSDIISFCQIHLPKCNSGFEVYIACRKCLFGVVLNVAAQAPIEKRDEVSFDIYEWAEIRNLLDALQHTGIITQPYTDNFKIASASLSKNLFSPDVLHKELEILDSYIKTQKSHKFQYYKPVVAAYLVWLSHRHGCDIGKTINYLSDIFNVSPSAIEMRYIKIKAIAPEILQNNIVYLTAFFTLINAEINLTGKLPDSSRKQVHYKQAKSDFQSFLNVLGREMGKQARETAPEAIDDMRPIMSDEFYEAIMGKGNDYEFTLEDIFGTSFLLMHRAMSPHSFLSNLAQNQS